MTYTQQVARRGEELAAHYLENLGFTVTARNFRVSHDEIDIIAEDATYIVFTEVKTRAQTASNMRYGPPAAAVDHLKKQRLLRSAEEYLRRNKVVKQPRIDIIEVYFPAVRSGTPLVIAELLPLAIKHYRNAVHK